MRHTILSISAAVLIVSATACAGGSSQPTAPETVATATGTAATSLPVDAKPFKINPADFTTEIDHPYWPMKPGSRWIFREEYENGKLKTTEGSWEAGVDGALPGIILPAHPEPGKTYREEYYAGQAEDGAEILSLKAHAKVPYGTFDHVLQTRNFTPIEPNLVEEKFYVQGVGPVLEITVTGGSDRTELASYKEG
jgi:hypothetical protein